MHKPKILYVDIETSPVLGHVWALFDQNVGLNQIEKDWAMLSWAANWDGEDKVLYMDNRKEKDPRNDKKILSPLWKLLDAADIVVAHNGRRFDRKKINARLILNGFKPPSPYKLVDTLLEARKIFGFTSNKLEYLSDALTPNQKKLVSKKFVGFELWKECLKGNRAAWNEMERYNKQDIRALKAVYEKIRSWGPSNVLASFQSPGSESCGTCSSSNTVKNGYAFTAAGRYQRYSCKDCGAWTRGGVNLLGKGAVRRGVAT
jgi:uncharacterized protein YprB with RNaseH-like and TPR domain